MKKKTARKMIASAIAETGKALAITDCHVEMNLEVGEVVTALANAMLEQAQANKANSEAMYELAGRLTPTEAHAFHITQTDS